MPEVPLIVIVAAVAFVSTNLDNLFLLLALMSESKHRVSEVALGYLGAMAVVLLLGVAGSYAVDSADPPSLRYLGFLPLAMGAWRLRGLLVQRTGDPENVPALAGIAPVFGLMLANSGDSVAVFAPLMAETSELLVVVVVVTALCMSLLWVVAARWVVEHPALAPRLRGLDRHLVPFLLIGIGLYILADTATDTM